MAEWSGLCSANSLPAETLQRLSMNARLVEHAARTPQGSVFESFNSHRYGIPIVAENLVGGAAQVSVNTFNRFQPGGRVVEPVDNWNRNHVAHTQFREFFSGYVRGQVPVREALPSFSRPVGPISYGAQNRQRRLASGVPSWYAALPGEPSIDPSNMMKRSHPSYTDDGSPWRREEEEARLHDGDCGSVHPYQSHRDWAASEEEEERQRIKSKYFEAVQEARDLGQSTIPVREGRGWKWCSTHQRWTRT